MLALMLGFSIAILGCAQKRLVAPFDTGGPQRWIPLDAYPKSQQVPAAPIQHVQAINSAGQHPGQMRKPKEILVLSGGGMYGAYTTGVLNGWTKAGNRPEFDVVTGISTGALIAPLAFLGPEYDGQIERFYTRVRRKDIYSYRSWATIPFRDGVASTEPLREILDMALNEKIIVRLGEEYAKGRRLYVGTTNLDTKRFVTWDITAIAAQSLTSPLRDTEVARKLIIDIMVASCSLPGVFAPMKINVELDGKTYTELHVDGGVTAPLFVPSEVIDAAAPDPTRPNSLQKTANVYVIQALKSFPESDAVEKRVLPILSASTSAMFSSQTRREVSNLYHMCKNANIKFHMSALREDFPTPAGGLEFDRVEMNKLFDEGYRVGSNGPLWWAAPTERAPGEIDTIRTGNRFRRPTVHE